MAILYSNDLTTAKKKLPPVGLDLVQEIITGLGVQCHMKGIFILLFMHHLTFGLRGIEVLKVLDLQANACLAHLVRYWIPKPVIICSIRSSSTGGNFFLLLLNPSNTRLPFLPTLYKL